MNRENEIRDANIIDLGKVTEETKGSNHTSIPDQVQGDLRASGLGVD